MLIVFSAPRNKPNAVLLFMQKSGGHVPEPDTGPHSAGVPLPVAQQAHRPRARLHGLPHAPASRRRYMQCTALPNPELACACWLTNGCDPAPASFGAAAAAPSDCVTCLPGRRSRSWTSGTTRVRAAPAACVLSDTMSSTRTFPLRALMRCHIKLRLGGADWGGWLPRGLGQRVGA